MIWAVVVANNLVYGGVLFERKTSLLLFAYMYIIKEYTENFTKRKVREIRIIDTERDYTFFDWLSFLTSS